MSWQIAASRSPTSGPSLNSPPRVPKKHAAQLPKEVQVVVKGLEQENAELGVLNTKQEALKADLVALTKQLRDKAKSANAKRTKVVRQAEATFGIGAVELRDFRSATDGKI